MKKAIKYIKDPEVQFNIVIFTGFTALSIAIFKILSYL